VNLFLRAVHGDRAFSQEERTNARDFLLDLMAAEVSTDAEVIPVDASREDDLPENEQTTWERIDRIKFPTGPRNIPSDANGERSQGEAVDLHSDVITASRARYFRDAAAQYQQQNVPAVAQRRVILVASAIAFLLVAAGGIFAYHWIPGAIMFSDKKRGPMEAVQPPSEVRTGKPASQAKTGKPASHEIR
jgi:hypothetical protein